MNQQKIYRMQQRTYARSINSILPNIIEHNQDADIQPEQLSGDENGSGNVLQKVNSGTKANFLLTVTTIIKTIIGSGILAMPYSINKLGWLLGSIVFILAGLMIPFGSILLLKAKNLSRHSNFTTIFYVIWKSNIAKGISSIIVCLSTFGVCISQFIVFKTSIQKIFTDVLETNASILNQFYTSKIFLVLVMTIIQTPFIFAKKLQKLRFMAFIGVVGIAIFMVTFIILFITSVLDDNVDNNPVGNMNALPQKWFDAAAAVPNILFALSYHIFFFPIFKGMRNVNDKKMSMAVLCGIGFCTISYLLMGILGYQYVGDKVEANFLRSLKYEKIPLPFYFIINFGFLISILFAFPIMFFGCRNNFIALVQLFLLDKQNFNQDQQSINQQEKQEIHLLTKNSLIIKQQKRRNKFFIISSIGIYLAIVGISIGVDDIKIVFNLVGAICSSLTGILLPCFFYFRLIIIKNQPKTVKFYVSIALTLIMAPYALFAIIAQYINLN